MPDRHFGMNVGPRDKGPRARETIHLYGSLCVFFTFVMHSEVVLGQSDGVALVLGTPEPWQWCLILVHVRVELLEAVHWFRGVHGSSCCGGRCSVRDYVECEQGCWGPG